MRAQILGGLVAAICIVAKVTDPSIASAAQDPAHHASVMTMICLPSLTAGLHASADRTSTILAEEEGIPFGKGESVSPKMLRAAVELAHGAVAGLDGLAILRVAVISRASLVAFVSFMRGMPLFAGLSPLASPLHDLGIAALSADRSAIRIRGRPAAFRARLAHIGFYHDGMTIIWVTISEAA